MKKCNACGSSVPDGRGHNCSARGGRAVGPDDSFLVSLSVAVVTGNPALGFIAGGNPAGAMIGSSIGNSTENDDDGHSGDDGGDD